MRYARTRQSARQVECASAEAKKLLPTPHSPPGLLRLLRVHMLVRALGAALAVKERQSGVDHLRCEAHFVVREVRQNRQAILRHVLALPAGILQSTA